MEGIISAHEQMEKRGNLAKTIQDLQKTIDLLQGASDSVASNPDTAAMTMAKLKQPVKQSFDKLDDDLREVNKGLNQYSKALDKKFKKTALTTASSEPLADQPDLINRAIVMHLLREDNWWAPSWLRHATTTLTGGATHRGKTVPFTELKQRLEGGK